MQQIRFHGRGGQGTVVAATILAKAYFQAGYWVQAFPLFGVERRGAPVEAYLRVAPEKIRVRSNVYTPDHVIVQDARLLDRIDVTTGLKPKGWVLINCRRPPDLSPFRGFRLAWVDATGIAVNNGLGTSIHPIMNTAMLGAFARTTGAIPLATLVQAIEAEINIKPQKNASSARQAWEAVHTHGLVN